MKLILYLSALSLLFCPHASAQNKMDLDDLKIKGDLLNSNRIELLNRDKNKLKNFVEYRTNYRIEIIEGLERPYPQYKFRGKRKKP